MPNSWWSNRGLKSGGRVLSMRVSAIPRVPVRWMTCCVILTSCGALTEGQKPRDPLLQRWSIEMYPPRNALECPTAFVFFFGNDVGFWGAHRDVASALTYRRIAVAGLDIRPALSDLPEADSLRRAAWIKRILPLIERSRHELGADCAPEIIAGHSLGAEIAVWTAAYARPPGVAGVLLLSPGSRSHLRISLSDLTMREEPSGAGSFSVADAIRALPQTENVSIVRGSRDKFAFADSLLREASAGRARVFVAPFSGHSLRSLSLSYPAVSRGIDWILEHRRTDVIEPNKHSPYRAR